MRPRRVDSAQSGSNETHVWFADGHVCERCGEPVSVTVSTKGFVEAVDQVGMRTPLRLLYSRQQIVAYRPAVPVAAATDPAASRWARSSAPNSASAISRRSCLRRGGPLRHYCAHLALHTSEYVTRRRAWSGHSPDHSRGPIRPDIAVLEFVTFIKFHVFSGRNQTCVRGRALAHFGPSATAVSVRRRTSLTVCYQVTLNVSAGSLCVSAFVGVEAGRRFVDQQR